MTEIADSLLAKIRALLAKAEGSEFPEEAEALTVKATELMAKYGIERALLAASAPESDIIGDREIHLYAPYARDKRTLIAYIAGALGCRVINRQRGNQIYAVLFGYASDLDRVEMLFTSLLVQSAHALAVTPVPFYDSPAAFRRTWYAGYAAMIGKRLRDAEEQARAEAAPNTQAGRSTSVVLVDRKDKLERAFADQWGHLKTGRERRLSGNGFRAGALAGQNADLGGQKVVGTSRRQISS